MDEKTDADISDAIARVHNWLDQFATLGGVDPEVAHRANYAELRTSDLRLILAANEACHREGP